MAPAGELLPLVALRDKVVFPRLMLPLDVGGVGAIAAVRHAIEHGSSIFLVTLRDKGKDPSGMRDLNAIGCIATVVQHLSLENGQLRLLVEGQQRARLRSLQDDGFPRAVVEPIVEQPIDGPQQAAAAPLARRALALLAQYTKLHPTQPSEAPTPIPADDPSGVADAIATQLHVGTAERQAILDAIDPVERLNEIVGLLEIEIEKLQLDRKISGRVKRQMDRAQREYYLNEKIKAIHKELGRKDERAQEIETLRTRIADAKLPPEAHEKATEELRRLEQMPNVSAEATVSRNYLQWLVDVPWRKKSRGVKDLHAAERILDEDHYGLDKIKERIVEYLAVRSLVKNGRGTILCFVGPPGVGKTSLARSIARATGRRYVRLSLGGIRDEAEIRGHRRTYIGAFPGQIVQMMKKAGTVNPVFLLDEVDKVGMDFRGDPTAALLEVLDPEQNSTFLDHYLDVPYDLSQVMFLATANVLHPISPPLLDRMEVIPIPSYTPLEKMEIARRFLLPRALESHGLTPSNLAFPDEAIGTLIDQWTREAGVRNLEREIGRACRKVARRVCKEGAGVQEAMTPALLHEYLGPPRYRQQENNSTREIGAATGLAWTEVGGQMLVVECTLMAGKGRLILTGKLGDVMRESAQAALSFVRSRVGELGIAPDFHRQHDIHIHLPEGAIPKDGPSAGITLATALISRLTGRPVRGDVAMTGEITLRGKVLAVGGIREKLLAAFRAGLRTVLLPRENERDLQEVAPEVRSGLQIHLVSHLDDVLPLALAAPEPDGEDDSAPVSTVEDGAADKDVPAVPPRREPPHGPELPTPL